MQNNKGIINREGGGVGRRSVGSDFNYCFPHQSISHPKVESPSKTGHKVSNLDRYRLQKEEAVKTRGA